jgi:Protein of unknown function (DUF998)
MVSRACDGLAAATRAVGTRAVLTRAALGCGIAAGPLFTAAFLIEGAARPGYSPLRHPVSSLALGPHGWVQVTNFSVAGALYLAGAAGLARVPEPALASRAGPMLIGAAALGLLGAAAFSTDPVSGYPPGTPAVPARPSPAGTVHNLAAVPVFFGLPAAALTYSWRFHRTGHPAWALYCAATATSMLVNVGLASAGFGQAPALTRRAGLFQRAAIGSGFGWLTALSARALRTAPRD